MAARKRKFRALAESVPLGSVVSEEVMAVMRGHPEFEKRCPPGSVIRRRPDAFNGWQREVWLDEDFLWAISWNVALKGKSRDIKTRIAQQREGP